MPTKYLHLDDLAINYLHAGASTLPYLPPSLGRGVALLFVHGEGGSAPLWSRQVAHFGAAHSPLAVDLPGHGRSSGLDGPDSVAAAANLVCAILDELRAPPTVVVGHGLGGQIALCAAIERPERVRGVVTIGTAARPEIAPALIEQLEAVVAGRLGQQFDMPYFGASPDMAVVRELWGEMARTDPRVRLSDVRAYRSSDLRGVLPSLRRRALVVHGDADRLCPVACAAELAAAIPGAERAIIAGAGHVAHLEQPDAVNRAIERFIAGV